VEETNTELVQNDETPTKSEATVVDDDVFEDAISSSVSSNEKEAELSDAKSEEVDAVLVPSASVVKEEEANDDAIAPSLEEKATAASTTDAGEEETTATSTGGEEQEKTTTAPAATSTTVGEDEEGKEQESEVGNSTAASTTDTVQVEDSEPQPSSTTTTTTSPSTLLLTPTCTIDIRVEFNPSPVGEKEALYDLLNKASRKKAQAINRLRKAAEEMNRSKQSTSDTTSTTMVTKSEAAVKKGFLNKSASTPAKKEPMVLVRWYNKLLGPTSTARVVFPVAKNYLLFFGGLFVMHFQGHQLALPPPV